MLLRVDERMNVSDNSVLMDVPVAIYRKNYCNSDNFFVLSVTDAFL